MNTLGLQFYNTCTILTGGLRLVNTSVSTEINNLSNVKTIIGGIEISYTNLENLEFLRSVKEVKFEDIMDKTGINVNIHHNPEMKYLGLKAVKVRHFETGTLRNRDILKL